MNKRPVLGRGLAALIPEAAPAERAPAESALKDLPIGLIDANSQQPRTWFDDEKLAELAASIREQGILQPLVVTARADGRYELIAGERRLRASLSIGLSHVPVIVREASDVSRLELALIENIQRDDLNALELAKAFQHLRDDFGYTQEQISQRVGKDRSTVSNHLRLLALPEEVQQGLAEGHISMGHARALLGLRTEAEVLVAYDQVIRGGLSVRQTERLVKDAGAPERPARPPAPEAPTEVYGEVRRRLERALSTRVEFVPRGRGGRIHIEYGSEDELNRILERLLT